MKGEQKMSFWDKASKVGKAVEKEIYKKQNEIDRRAKQMLRQKSDAEIERAYRNRYDNPNLSSRGIELLEEEAERRGIS